MKKLIVSTVIFFACVCLSAKSAQHEIIQTEHFIDTEQSALQTVLSLCKGSRFSHIEPKFFGPSDPLIYSYLVYIIDANDQKHVVQIESGEHINLSCPEEIAQQDQDISSGI